MRNWILISAISFLNLFHCALISSPQPKELDQLCSTILYNIAQYLELPHRELSSVNRALNKVFKEDIAYQVFLSRQLNIPEIKMIENGHEKELLPVGDLVHFKDPVHVFKAIRHDLIKLKSFPNIAEPLLKHIHSIYNKSDNEAKRKLDPYDTFVEDLSKYLIENEKFELLIEFKMEEPLNIFKRLLTFDRTQSYLPHISYNEVVKNFYIDCLKKISYRLLIKTAYYAVISAIPEVSFLTVVIIKERINNNSEPESELNCLIDFYEMLELFSEYREISVSPEPFENSIKPVIRNMRRLGHLTALCALVDKKDILNEIIKRPEMVQAFIKLYQSYSEDESLKIENAKIMFEYFLIYSSVASYKTFKTELFKILTKFYFYKRITIINGILSIIFSAPKMLIKLGFPVEVNFEKLTGSNYYNYISSIWDEMVVSDLVTFKEFFKSYLNLPNITSYSRTIVAGSDVLRFFAQDAELVELALSNGIIFLLNNVTDKALLLKDRPVPDFNRILTITNKLALLKCAKNDSEVRIVEEIVGTDVSQIILDHYSYEDLTQLTEDDYFELRHSLKYWVKRQNLMVYNINRIESDVILSLLKQEVAIN